MQQNPPIKSTKILLQYLQEKNYDSIFSKLQKKTNIQIQHECLTELEKYILNGDFESTEKIITNLEKEAIFEKFVANNLPIYHLKHRKIEESPPPRSSQSMCFDPQKKTVFLIGGIYEKHKLHDFWKFEMDKKIWTKLDSPFKISGDEKDSNKDGQFKIHKKETVYKLFWNPSNSNLYVFRQFTNEKIPLQLFAYNFQASVWEFIETVIDPQTPNFIHSDIVMDHFDGMLYCFCGSQNSVVGFYQFDLKNLKWNLLSQTTKNNEVILTRENCSLMLDSKNFGDKVIIICGGKYDEDPLSDIILFNTKTQQFTIHHPNIYKQGIRKDSLIRSFLDEEDAKIYLLCENNKRDIKTPKRELWVYDIAGRNWGECQLKTQKTKENKTLFDYREGHSTLFDINSKTIHFFFGIVHKQNYREKLQWERLQMKYKRTVFMNDSFQLVIEPKKDLKGVLSSLLFIIRKELFLELLDEGNQLLCVELLQNKITPLVNQDSWAENKELRVLSNLIFSTKPLNHDKTKSREKILQLIMQNLPNEMKAPKTKLSDII
ncbi:muskelin [Anaeramoeba ignava]|uniref:Muskelin n=1 Tax=Anaeramoeba ignava TaxID=1746090 RepID=A0A9Q0LH01_ANAIG|nr:muskelin [Anaeramoeba ignava]